MASIIKFFGKIITEKFIIRIQLLKIIYISLVRGHISRLFRVCAENLKIRTTVLDRSRFLK